MHTHWQRVSKLLDRKRTGSDREGGSPLSPRRRAAADDTPERDVDSDADVVEDAADAAAAPGNGCVDGRKGGQRLGRKVEERTEAPFTARQANVSPSPPPRINRPALLQRSRSMPSIIDVRTRTLEEG